MAFRNYDHICNKVELMLASSDNRQHVKAFAQLNKLPVTECPRRNLLLFLCYLYGFGTPPKPLQAMICLDALQDTPLCDEAAILRGSPDTLRQLTQLAGNGNGDACGIIAGLYERGEGVNRDLRTARDWAEKGSGAYCAEVRTRLLTDYPQLTMSPGEVGREANRELLAHHREKAAELFEFAAGLGDVDAMGALGDCYYYAIGRERDYNKAYAWYIHALHDDWESGSSRLARCCERGRGIEQDLTAAMDWFRKSATDGNPHRLFQLGEACCRLLARETQPAVADYLAANPALANEAFDAYRRAAEQGHVSAKKALALLCFEGVGTAPDAAWGQFWLTEALADGARIASSRLARCAAAWSVCRANREALYAVAQAAYDAATDDDQSSTARFAHFLLGVCAAQRTSDAAALYGLCALHGRGTKRDTAQAFSRLMTASPSLPQAQFALGTLYAHGDGCTANTARAYLWLSMAVEGGYVPNDEEASLLRWVKGNCFDARGFEKEASGDDAGAFADYQTAWDCGNVNAGYALACLYQDGRGVSPNADAAWQLFEQTAMQGCVPAMLEMADWHSAQAEQFHLQDNGTARDREMQQALRWMTRAAEAGDDGAAAYMRDLSPAWLKNGAALYFNEGQTKEGLRFLVRYGGDNPDIQAFLGEWYLDADDRHPELSNIEQAKDWLLRAAASDQPEAQLLLATGFKGRNANPFGLTDEQRADYLDRAAENGSREAQNLNMYQ